MDKNSSLNLQENSLLGANQLLENDSMPNYDDELKPKVGQIFDTLAEGKLFYQNYAHNVGFSVRSSSETTDKNGVKRWKYFVCSKEGYLSDKKKDEVLDAVAVKSRRRSLTREGCNANAVFKWVEGGKYELARFNESHTHALASPSKRPFLRSARKVNPMHKSLLHAYGRANIGPSKSFHLMKEQFGGYENVGCTQKDLQNYKRDLQTLLKDSDANVFIDNFRRKQELNPSFFYAYEVDEEDRLRLCMWHIMKKVSEKIGASLNDDEEFNQSFKSCVWGSETPDEFEETWDSIIFDFELEENEWLSYMFEIRSMWIPAYFKDVLLAGIMRTTSRSESENSFYGNFLNPNVNLVEFWMRFDSAIEAQRHKELLADNSSIHSIPKLMLDRDIEKHARDVYAREKFYIFQKELWMACVDCGIENKKEEDGMEIFLVHDNSKVNRNLREVVYNLSYHNANCSCKMFQAEGIPCRHILCVVKGKKLNEIPSKYILNRWTKFANKKPVFDIGDIVYEKAGQGGIVSNVWDKLFRCVEKAGQDKEKLLIVLNGAVIMEKELDEFEGSSKQTKTNDLETYIRTNIPERVEILPPQFAKTKGSGKRIKSGKEKAVEQQQKRTRLCKACGEYAHHNSRNCPNK
ncbi:protein FAR1-RELATED SEQUENCE 5-like [Medicago truncatula]|uniref:protein FAR1-RELATED SEQUENCE 5-like n=1 Tax=Medicago truncatula TaxID=3880 RepID=UPI000D2F3419|nr:protein FAR1-RELATED SEQUENCE 5-like [Medicago truncatula]